MISIIIALSIITIISLLITQLVMSVNDLYDKIYELEYYINDLEAFICGE